MPPLSYGQADEFEWMCLGFTKGQRNWQILVILQQQSDACHLLMFTCLILLLEDFTTTLRMASISRCDALILFVLFSCDFGSLNSIATNQSSLGLMLLFQDVSDQFSSANS